MTENESELIQTFTLPNGKTFKEGHQTIWVSEKEHITTSFEIDEKGKRKNKRTYRWIKRDV